MITPPSSASAATAAGTAPQFRRRRRLRLDRLAGHAAPYALLLPAAAVMGAILAYPLYFLGRLSFEKYGLFELIRHSGKWVGTQNYSQIFHDSLFWHVLLRTLVFTGVCVALTMALGTMIALLLAELGPKMRLLVNVGLIFVWATPVVVAVDIWYWMVDFEFGVLNWTLTKLHFGNFIHHDWFQNPWTGWGVIVAIVVWGAIPFVAITLYAGLTQVPRELVEAAETDGATPWRVFRDVTVPLMKPIFIILTSLSIIWDFQVFNQVWIIRDYRPTTDYYLMSIYAYVNAFGQSEYGLGAAIALVMVAILLIVSFFYVRQMVKIGEVQ